MSAEKSKAVVSRFYEELWNDRNIGIANEIIAADWVTPQLRSGAELVGVQRGPEVVKHHVAEWLTGFPDLRFKVEQLMSGHIYKLASTSSLRS